MTFSILIFIYLFLKISVWCDSFVHQIQVTSSLQLTSSFVIQKYSWLWTVSVVKLGFSAYTKCEVYVAVHNFDDNQVYWDLVSSP